LIFCFVVVHVLFRLTSQLQLIIDSSINATDMDT